MLHGCADFWYGRCYAFVKSDTKEIVMNYRVWRSSAHRHDAVKSLKDQAGKAGWILLWALGVPIPVLLLFFLLRGCT